MYSGSACVPVNAPVFKIGGRLRRVGDGGFDSHALPTPIGYAQVRLV